MDKPLGYRYLVEHYALPVLPLDISACVTSGVRSRETRRQGSATLLCFAPSYDPGEALPDQIQFALRYEGVNLQVLAFLFERIDGMELAHWLMGSPASAYARRACFLFEWLTGKQLPVDDPVSPRAAYVSAVDHSMQFVLDEGERQSRFRVIDNLPGTPAFCPLVRKTDYLKAMHAMDLQALARSTLARYDADLLRRAAAFLYLKETQSSFEVEREKPSHNKAQRFADLLRLADTREPVTMDRLVMLQNAVIDPRFHEFTWRQQQNWIGKDMGFRQLIDFVPARPEDLPSLMSGLLVMAGRLRADLECAAEGRSEGPVLMMDYVKGEYFVGRVPIDPVVAAASIAFGFVYIHPFMDGNGRIHRYLIHDVLAKAGFTPRGIVLPVSAVILTNLDDYIATLEHFSRPLNARTRFDPEVPDAPATGNDAVYFRYPDLTCQAEFLYRALHRTVTVDLQEEIDFLLGFDRARTALGRMLDWPGHALDLFIRLVHQNDGVLSQGKRKRYFSWMTDEEVREAEVAVTHAFSSGPS